MVRRPLMPIGNDEERSEDDERNEVSLKFLKKEVKPLGETSDTLQIQNSSLSLTFFDE